MTLLRTIFPMVMSQDVQVQFLSYFLSIFPISSFPIKYINSIDISSFIEYWDCSIHKLLSSTRNRLVLINFYYLIKYLISLRNIGFLILMILMKQEIVKAIITWLGILINNIYLLTTTIIILPLLFFSILIKKIPAEIPHTITHRMQYEKTLASSYYHNNDTLERYE